VPELRHFIVGVGIQVICRGKKVSFVQHTPEFLQDFAAHLLVHAVDTLRTVSAPTALYVEVASDGSEMYSTRVCIILASKGNRKGFAICIASLR
jgi:hypothetical protein